MKHTVIYILGVLLIIAGLYTFYTSTAALFSWFGGSKKEAIYIELTQICCLISSAAYFVCGILFFLKKKLATPILFITTIVMFIGYIAMLFHINEGKFVTIGYVGEMLIRTTSTMLYAAASWYIFTRTRFIYPPGHDAKSFKKLMKEYQAKEMRKMREGI